jgi:LCP family protein required for cell wall assembly
MPSDGDKRPPDRPEYNVYRSRKGPFSRFRGSGIEKLREKNQHRSSSGSRRGGGEEVPYPVYRPEPAPDDRPARRRRRWTARRVVKWIAIAAFGWFLLSVLAFAVSAQIQSMKLDSDARAALQGNPWLLPQAQNILVIGTDSRPPDTLEPGAAQEARCYEQQARGEAPRDGCPGARADTLMVVRAGGGQFRKLSIPRDSYAEIPGQDTQKINAAYAFGGAKLQIETVSDFLGIPIDHVVIMNFTGFEDFIDAIGGVEIELDTALCADISGGEANGGWTIELEEGSNTLNGADALAYARTRKPSPCPGTGSSAFSEGYDDLDRAAAQQNILNGIKDRLTSPLRLPYNFIKGPIIGWTAPKAFVSDIGFLGMPQLALSSVFAGTPKPDVLIPSGNGPDGSLEIPVEERRRAARQLEGG